MITPLFSPTLRARHAVRTFDGSERSFKGDSFQSLWGMDDSPRPTDPGGEMSPIVKRVLAALAIKEVIDRVQEARKPKRSLFGRLGSPLVLAALGGSIFYLYKNGKLDPVIEQGKDLLGRNDEAAYTPPAPTASSL
jgi:hypothetical protein